MADTQDIIDYYANLLIIQYHNKPKAKATIEELVSQLLATGVLFDIRDGYSIDTAVGKQLDVIGKYVGVNRYFETQELFDYFGLTTYTEVNPDALDKWGFTTYSTFEDFQYNGTLNYETVLSQSNALTDEDFRVIIRLKILQNNINHSHKEIDDTIFKIFGDAIRPNSAGDMAMTYFITDNLTAIIKAALDKSLLPRPMGVSVTLISGVSEPFFGFARYGYTPDLIIGFTDYAHYDTKEGQTLIYDQITAG